MKTTVAIELDKVRNLRFDVNALVKIEELTGKPIVSIDSEELGIKDIRSIVYAGLKWEDTKLTMDKTGEIMTEAMAKEGIEYLIDKISEGLELAFGISEEKKLEGPGQIDYERLFKLASSELGLSAFEFVAWTPKELFLGIEGKKEKEKNYYEALKYVVAFGVQSAFSGKDKRLFKSEKDEHTIDPDKKKEEIKELYKKFGVVK